MTSEPDSIIVVRDLCIGWGDRILMEHLSFDVARAERFVILGGSGSGKSTLLQNLIGLVEPRSGTILIDGSPPPAPETAPPRFGVMFQSGALFGSMTLLENVSLPLNRWTDLPADAIEEIALARLRLVALEGFENHSPSEISGGMKKRAGIARALALEPSLLFLDEPSAGLDPISSVELDELLLTLNEELGVTLVMVTHELESIDKVATRCIVLDGETRGIIADGPPRELRSQTEPIFVKHFFNREPRSA